MASSSDIFVAKESFVCILYGEPHTIHANVTRVRAGHPILEGRGHLFRPLDVQYDVEQATAAPGEKRGVKKVAADE